VTQDLFDAPPMAERRRTVHVAHGVRRDDDYSWLRAVDDECVLAYLRAERDYYEATTAHLHTLRDHLAGEMIGRTPGDDTSVRWHAGGMTYCTQTIAGQEYERLYRIDDDDTLRLLLDPNALTDGPYLALGLVEPSPDGRLLAYSLDLVGDEIYELRFRDLATGRDLPDRLPRTDSTGAWSADSTAFLYTVPDPAHRPDRVQLHRLGEAVQDDRVLLNEPDEHFELSVQVSRDGAWVVVTSASRDTTEVHLLSAAAPQEPPRLVAARRAGVDYAVEVLPGDWDGKGADRLLVVSDDGEPEFRLLVADLPGPGQVGDPETWTPVARAVGGSFERLVSATVLAGHVVLELRRDGEPFLRVLDRVLAADGRRQIREVHPGLPCGQLRVWKAHDPAASTVIVVEENLVTAPVWVQVDLTTGARQVLKRAVVPGMDAGRYVTERILATSADGTRVPVTIARLRTEQQSSPSGSQGTASSRQTADAGVPAAGGVLLYGYGAYESCSWPQFSVATLSLLDRGVVYAVAHVRGGGELGRRWWLDGRLRSKQHTVDDFLAARDALVGAGWAGEHGVVCRGLSAGGLLAGIAFSQAPDRWRAVVAEVPFVDVVTTLCDPTIPLTISEWDEWGDPIRSAEDFASMLAYSPYDNPPPPGRPALLVTGAVKDPRVLVHEPAKWVARLRATDDAGSPSPLLFRAELGQGAHGGPSGRLAALRYEAEICAWVLEQLDAAGDDLVG
jgi:oligopeptidase B